MQEKVLKFWKYIKETWDSEEINNAIEDYEFDKKRISKNAVSKLSDDEIVDLFSDLVEFVMDGFGIDNYGEIFEILKDNVGLSEDEISRILD